MSASEFAVIPIGYLLGAIPFSYIIGYLFGRIDLRLEGDGRISAAAIYRRAGRLPFLLAVLFDVVKGALAVYISTLLTDTMVLIFA